MKNPNRYGTCYKLSGKRRNPYIARAYTGKDKYGKPIYQTIGYFKTKSEGLKALMEYNVKLYDISQRKITLKEVFDLWKENHIKYVSEKAFINNYEKPFEKLENLFGEYFNDLRPLHYQTILDRISNQYSITYLSKIKTVLTQLYKFAQMQDICEKDYSQGIKITGKSEKEQKHFTDLEVAKMIKLAPKIKNTDCILTLCLMGLRPTELLNITKFNVDLKNRMVFNIGIKTEKGKAKRIPISNILFPYFEQRYNDTTNYLFGHSNGSKMDYATFIRNIYKPCLKALKIDYKPPKSGRHFFATISNQQGLNSKAITDMIGHTNIEFTKNKYTHTEDSFLKNEYEKIDEVFKNL